MTEDSEEQNNRLRFFKGQRIAIRMKKLGYRRTGETEIVNDKMTFVFYEKDKV